MELSTAASILAIVLSAFALVDIAAILVLQKFADRESSAESAR